MKKKIKEEKKVQQGYISLEELEKVLNRLTSECVDYFDYFGGWSADEEGYIKAKANLEGKQEIVRGLINKVKNNGGLK